RFAVPAAEAVTAPGPRAPVASPAGATPRASRSWIPWAVVAAVVIAVAAVGYPVSQHFGEYRQAQRSYEVAQRAADEARHERERTIAKRQGELTEASARIEQKEKEFGQLQVDHVARVQELHQEAEKREMVLRVTGPPAIQPGAP